MVINPITALYGQKGGNEMKIYICKVCGKLNCWALFEINRGPAMCQECWEKIIEEVKGNVE